MYQIIIGGNTLTFENEDKLQEAINQAELDGLSIEIPEGGIKVDSNQVTQTESNQAPESAFGQVMDGVSPENFMQDPVESADAVSETVAQEDMVLDSEDTSLEFPEYNKDLFNKSLIIKGQSYNANDVVDSVKNGDVQLSGRVGSAIYKFKNGKNTGQLRDNVSDDLIFSAYASAFPGSKIVEGVVGGKLDEVVLSDVVQPSPEGGTNPFGDTKTLAKNLEYKTWDEQKDFYKLYSEKDPNMSIKFDVYGVQEYESQGRSKTATITYIDPSTGKTSDVKVNEGDDPSVAAAKIINFSNKNLSYEAAMGLAAPAKKKKKQIQTVESDFTRIGEDVLNSNLTRFKDPENIFKDFNQVELQEGVDTSFDISPWSNIVSGRTLSELNENIDFRGAVKDKIVETFEKQYPGKKLPSDAFINSYVTASIANKVAIEIQEKKKDVLATKNYMLANGEYVNYLDAAFKEDQEKMEGTPMLAASSAINRSRQIVRRLKAGNDDNDVRAQLFQELEGIQLAYPTLLKAIDEDYKPYMNLTTGARLSKADFKELEKGGEVENYKDMTEEDKQLQELYSSMPIEKLEFEYFSHQLETQKVKEAFDQIIGTFSSNIPEEVKNFKELKENFNLTKNPDGTYSLRLADYSRATSRLTSFVFEDDILALLTPEQKEKADVLSELLLKDTADLVRREEALQKAYLLNIDPISMKQGFGDDVTRFFESTAEASLGADYTTMIGTSVRKELDEIESMLTESDITLSNQEKEAFHRGVGTQISEGVSAFVPAIFQFAVANKVQGAIGVTRLIGNLVKAGNSPLKKVVGHVIGSIAEEVKFRAVAGDQVQLGGGTGFYLGGLFMRAAIPFRFKGIYAAANPLLEKVALGGIGGAVSSDVAVLVEGLVQNMSTDGAFKEKMHELYGMDAFSDPLEDGKETGWFERFLVNSAVFGLVGATHMKKMDFNTMGTLRKKSQVLYNELKTPEKYTDKQLKQKQDLLDLIEYRITQSESAEYKKSIGDQSKTKAAAQRIIDSKKVVKTDLQGFPIGFRNALPVDIRNALKVIAKVDANIATTERSIKRQADRFIKSGVLSEAGYTLDKIEISKEPLANGDKAFFMTNGKKLTLKVDINKFKPGVYAHEMFHLFSKVAFNSNPAFAEAFKTQVSSKVNSALKGVKLKVNGKGSYTFEEAMAEAYKDKNTAEEFIGNTIELLGQAGNRHLLLKEGLMTGVSRDFKNMAKKAGIPYNLEKNYETAHDLLELMNTFRVVAEGGSAKSLKNTFDAFKNIIIDGKKLVNVVGTEFTGEKEIKETLDSSKDIDVAEKKDIFSKATKNYTDMIGSGSSAEQAGVMVGYDFAPLVRKKLRSYIDKKGLEIPDAIIEDIISDVTLSSGKGSTGIPSLVQSYTKGRNLIDYIKDNPQATSADISKKAEEFGVRSDRVQSFTDLAKEGGEATMTSYVFGQLNNRILASMQKPEFSDIFNTFSIDKDPTKAANIAEGEGLGGAPTGFVDISSPELNTRINNINAQVTLKVPEDIRNEIAEVGPKIVLTVPLRNIDAKTEGQVVLPDGGVAKVVISKNDQAVINIEGQPTDVIKARSPKIIEKKLGTAAKSFVKTATTKEKLTRDALDLIYPKLEKVAGPLKDNYTPTQKYAEFIDNAFPLLKNYISQSAVNKRFKEFKDPVIDKETGKQKREKTAAGKPIFTKKNITLAEWRKYFIGDGSMRIDGRRRSIIEALSSELGFDSIMETLSKEAMREQIESRQEDIGVDLIENYVAVIAKEFDRGNPSKQSSAFIEQIKEGGAKDPTKFLQEYSRLFEEGNTENWENLEGAENWIKAVTTFLQPIVKTEIDRRVQLNTKTGKNEGETVYTKFEEQAIKYGLDPEFAKIIANFNENIAVKFDKDGNIISSNQKTAAARKNELDVDFAIRELLKGIDPEFTKVTQGNYYYESTEGGFLASFFKHTSRYVGTEKYSNKTVLNEAGERVQAGFKDKFEKELFAEPEKQTDLDIEIQERTKKLFEDIKKNETTFIKETEGKKSGYTLSKQISDFRKSTKLILNGAKIKFKNAKGETVEIDYGNYTAEQKAEAVFNQEGREAVIKDLKLKQEFMEIMLLNIGNTRQKIAAQPNSEIALERFDKGVSAILFAGDGRGIRMFSFEQYFQIGQKYKVKFKNDDGKIEEKLVFEDKNEHIEPKLLFTIQVLNAMKNGELTSAQSVKSVTEGYKSIIGSKRGQKLSDFFTGTTITDAKYLKMILATGVSKMVPVTDIIALKSYLNIETGKTAFQELMVDVANQIVTNKAFQAGKGAIEFNNKDLKGFGLSEQNTTTSAQVSSSKNIDKAFEKSKDPNKKPKGISVFDFDDTLAQTKSNVLYTLPNGKKGKLNATEFAKKSEALEAKGAEFDFSEFSKVMQGKLGPLFSEAKKKEGKYTNKDIFILTARPSNSAIAIMEFLKSEGLEIPLENIVGLGNGAASAKANWMIEKVAEGYNDFYFADDAIKNVEAVRDALGLFDIKSDVQQAIMRSANINLEKSLAGMIERKKGIPAKGTLSPAIASNMGKKKGRFDWFIPPNAEDFGGLMYKFYGKGKQGDQDMAIIRETLIRPFNRGENAISTYKQTLAADYSALEKRLGDMKTVIKKDSKVNLEKAKMNSDQAVRVFIYDKLGYDIPGLKQNEIDNLVGIVNGDPRLKQYAEGVMSITKTDRIFPRPGETWYSSNIRYELFKYATEGVRGEFLKEWQGNVDKMFTEDNFARIEAGYGKDYVVNLKEMLERMKTGKTRSSNLGKDVQKGMDYVNGSVGVIMFLNTRSAVLQTISAINYVNWSDNNPLMIGKAVLKPKEWGKTFMEIYNSDFLQQRRSGLEINVEEAEIAKAVERSKGNARNLFDNLIKIGFKPTQLADSFAIAFGGTPFLMNRTKTYEKMGLTPEEARKRAFEDFRDVSEDSQQSSRADKVSNIQTGVAGRLIFAFANTPMQMSRLTKKAMLDLANGRGDAKTNISKMIYYGGVQSYIFYALQQSQFLKMFGGDDEDMTEEEKEFNDKKNKEKNTRIANSMFDSFISGSGSPGKVAITAKNTILKYYQEKEKGYKADYGDVLNEALSISPPLSSKTKKIYSAYKSYKHFSTKKGQEELAEYGQYAFDNPMLMANAKVFSSISNIPADRLVQKVNNLYSAFTDETLTPIQSVALAAGWDKWSLGLYDPKFMTANEIAANKKARKEQLKKEKAAKKKAIIESYDMNMSEPERRDVLKVLTKDQQLDSLWNLGMPWDNIKSLKKENDRIEAIIKLQNKIKFDEDMLKISNTTRQDSLK